MPSLRREQYVFVLDLGDDENRFHPDWIDAVNACIDEVEAAEIPRALVTTASGKIWSNGLDIEWLGENTDKVNEYVASVHALFARFLAMGVPSVAALQGHTFAAGAMLALAHDERFMRADRGYYCLPEVDIFIPFTPGMTSLIMDRLPIAAAHEAMTTGRRYGGSEAEAAGIVHRALPEDQVLPAAIERAGELASKDPKTLATIKQRMYAATLASLADDAANRFPTDP